MADRRRSLFELSIRPGLLAVLGLVLVVGGCFAVESAGDYGEAPASSYTGAPPVVAAPSPPPQPNVPTWIGTVRVTDAGINMDTEQPAATNVVGGDAAVQFDGSNLIPFGASAGLWTAATDPSYEQCLQLVETQPISPGTLMAYSPDRGLCVLTEQRTAMGFLRGTGNPGPAGVEMHAIRWAVR